jgi:hypothetical protein
MKQTSNYQSISLLPATYRILSNILLRLTPWSRVLPEKLKCPKLLKKFPAFYGTGRFISVFTRARHLALS